MSNCDLTPLFRTSVRFDRMSRVMEPAIQMDGSAKGYPPYNIAKRDQYEYRISLTVAGFTEPDLHIELHNNQLTVTGRRDTEGDDFEYLHQGIAGRSFERRFQLADHIKVVGAQLENGLLHVELERHVPETLKPRPIQIGFTKGNVLDAAK